jgi:hypothetical protein
MVGQTQDQRRESRQFCVAPSDVAVAAGGEGFPESLASLRDEDAVRHVLDDFNRRVKRDRLAPSLGPMSYVVARTVDVDGMIAQWRDLRGR